MFINNKYQRIFADILVFIMFLLFFSKLFWALNIKSIKEIWPIKNITNSRNFFSLIAVHRPS